MKTIRVRSGPFSERPHFKLGEIERMCVQELRAAGLLPTEPSPVRIERFIERRFGVSPRYEELPEGVLGFTKFGQRGVTEVVIAAQLDSDASPVAQRRLRSTLAHEAGHGLLHTYLFALGTKPASLLGEKDTKPHILCRDVEGEHGHGGHGYDGRWWEFQANRAIGGFLLPRTLVEKACEPFLVGAGQLGMKQLPDSNRIAAVKALADIFDVNPAVVRIHLAELFSSQASGQLNL